MFAELGYETFTAVTYLTSMQLWAFNGMLQLVAQICDKFLDQANKSPPLSCMKVARPPKT
jgi:hypothetical protein